VDIIKGKTINNINNQMFVLNFLSLNEIQVKIKSPIGIRNMNCDLVWIKTNKKSNPKSKLFLFDFNKAIRKCATTTKYNGYDKASDKILFAILRLKI
jgi:hypothetical protein